MFVLVRTELLKLATTRAPWLLAAGAVLLTAILAVQPVQQAGRGKPSIGTAGAALGVVDALGRGALIALVLGVLMVTTEFRFHTVTGSLLGVPARLRLQSAKALAAALVALVLAVLGVAVVVLVGVISGAVRGYVLNGDIVLRAVGFFVTYPAYAVLGLAVGGMLPRSQPLAVVLPVAWLLGLEALVLSSLLPPTALRWSVNGAFAAMQNAGNVPQVLPVWLGTAIVLGLVTTLFMSAAARIARTDIT